MEHQENLANRLNLDRAEASELLAELAGSLCRRLFPEQKRRDDLGRLQQIIDHLGEGVVVSDMDGELLDWNPAALRIHGFDSVDEVRRNLATFAQQFELCEPGGPPLALAHARHRARASRGLRRGGEDRQARARDGSDPPRLGHRARLGARRRLRPMGATGADARHALSA